MPQIISMMAKSLRKHVEYMFLSSKKRTGVWFSRYGNFDQSFISIGREKIIILADRKSFVRLYTAMRERLTTKLPPVISTFWAFVKNPKWEGWVDWSSAKAGRIHGCKWLTERSCSTCAMTLAEEGDWLRFSSSLATGRAVWWKMIIVIMPMLSTWWPKMNTHSSACGLNDFKGWSRSASTGWLRNDGTCGHQLRSRNWNLVPLIDNGNWVVIIQWAKLTLTVAVVAWVAAWARTDGMGSVVPIIVRSFGSVRVRYESWGFLSSPNLRFIVRGESVEVDVDYLSALIDHFPIQASCNKYPNLASSTSLS